MANTLLDAVKQSQNDQLAQPAAQLGAGPASETQSLANTIAVGQTGKASPGGAQAGGPKMSNLQERLANVQTRLGTQALAKDTQIQQEQQDQGAEVAARAAQIQDTALEQKRQQTQTEYTQKVQATLDSYRQQNKTLDFTKDKAKAEQIGFQLRLSNTKYIDDLKREGTKARLTSNIARKQQIAATAFQEEQDMLNNNLTFQQMLNAKGRDLQSQLQNIDLDFAMQMADAQNKAANQQQMWQGIGGLATAGIQAGAAYAGSSSTGAPATTTGSAAPSQGYTAAGYSSTAADGGYGGGGPR